MPRFLYKAVDRTGKRHQGVIEGASPEAAMRSLKAQGRIPIALDPEGAGLWARLNRPVALAGGVGTKEVARFTQQLAALLGAGLPLERALGIVEGTSRSTVS